MKTPLHRKKGCADASLRVLLYRGREAGSTLVVGLVTLAVLTLITAATFQTVSSRFRSNYQTASWHDALTSAESGASYAFTRLRTPLTKPDPSVSGNTGTGTQLPGLVLTNPLKVSGSIQSDLATLTAGASCVNGTVLSATYNGTTYTRIQLPTIVIPHVGQGSTQFTAVATVDAVPGTSTLNNGAGTWYRIQSVGTVPLSGSANVGIQKYDNFLRKLQFHTDSFGNALSRPQAVRTIEVIVKPVTIGSSALFGQTGINLNNQNVVINSYDSRNPGVTSAANGTYDPTKTTSAANVVTDDNPQSNGTPGVINLSPTGAYVYGNVATNNTPVSGSTGHVSGTVTENFYQALPNPPDPNVVTTSWSSYSDTSVPMTTGTASSPAYYKMTTSNGDLSLSGHDTLNITAPSDGSEGYVQIWVPGQLSTTGNAGINIPAHVHVTFYINGNVSIAGNGILNNSLLPSNLTVYGNHDPTVSQSITVAGNGVFAGMIYGPSANVSAKGSGTNGDIYGAIFSNSISFNGTTSLHYDQALGDFGAVIDYRVASWYEDNTLTR